MANVENAPPAEAAPPSRDRPNSRPLRPGDNCWKIERADAVSIIIDADDYFRASREAMLKARHRIMLIGWDFDARISLGPCAPGIPDDVGNFIYWLVERNPDLEVFLLRWDVGAVKTIFRGSTIFTLMKWMRHPRIHTKLDSLHPAGASHHQKIVVIDDCFAFCGGIDITGGRWDTRAHPDDDSGRLLPNGKPYSPWHDATTALKGAAAAALGKLGRDRWHRAGGHTLAPITGKTDCWPASLPQHFNDVDVAISRSIPEMDGQAPVIEIEQLYLDQIARAKRIIYAESQYFASRRIAEAIARRLDEPDGPEIVIINPESADGWLEQVAMDTARARLFEALKHRDHNDRLRIYHPFTAAGVPIYVHAKILIIDDQALRIGSSNMNNRSLRLDTECDVTIDASLEPNSQWTARIAEFRNDLLAEHLDTDVGTIERLIAERGSLIATIEALRGTGKTLRPYQTPDVSSVEAWLAENEILDPEGPQEMLEPLAKRGLFRRWKFRRTKR